MPAIRAGALHRQPIALCGFEWIDDGQLVVDPLTVLKILRIQRWALTGEGRGNNHGISGLGVVALSAVVAAVARRAGI